MGRPVPPPYAALFGPGARYEGDFAFEGRVRIDGHFVGRIYSEEELEIGPDGLVEGDLDVARAVISGTVRGSLRAREQLTLRAGARISGKLDVGLLLIEPGARVEGTVLIHGAEIP